MGARAAAKRLLGEFIKEAKSAARERGNSLELRTMNSKRRERKKRRTKRRRRRRRKRRREKKRKKEEEEEEEEEEDLIDWLELERVAHACVHTLYVLPHTKH